MIDEDIMEKIMSVAPSATMFSINPVTTWFVRRDTVKNATASPSTAPAKPVNSTANSKLFM